LVRKFEKRSSSSHGEEPNDRHLTQTLCQNYSRQDLFQDSLALKAFTFRAVCVELIVGQIQSQGQNYLSVRFILRIFEVTLVVFRDW